VTDHSLEATPPSEMCANAIQILGAIDIGAAVLAVEGAQQHFDDAAYDDDERAAYWEDRGRTARESARAELQSQLDAIRRLLASARARAQTLETEVAQMRGAILWACGEGADFPPRPEGAGAYWWRKELRARALSPQRRDETP
jgi:hypothetical protein